MYRTNSINPAQQALLAIQNSIIDTSAERCKEHREQPMCAVISEDYWLLFKQQLMSKMYTRDKDPWSYPPIDETLVIHGPGGPVTVCCGDIPPDRQVVFVYRRPQILGSLHRG